MVSLHDKMISENSKVRFYKSYGILLGVTVLLMKGNQEDSIMLNKSSVDRGMFVHTCYKTMQCEEKKKTNCTFEKIEIPPAKSHNNTMNYSKLSENGVIKKGTPVVKGDIIIGKTLTKVKTDEDDDKTDCSLAVGNGEEGIIDDIWEGINDEGNRMVKVKIRQIRIPEVGDKCACFDDTTSVLTSKGWKNIKDITLQDKIATLQNNKLVYNNPINTFEYDYNGKMYHLESQQLDVFATPNHNLYVKKRDHNEYGLYKAEDVFGKRVSYKKNADWEEKDTLEFSYDGQNYVNTKDWCYFLGIWMAEGWASGKDLYGCIGISVNKERVRNKLFHSLDNMNIKYTYDNKQEKCLIYNKSLYMHMKPMSVGAPNKHLPDYVWGFSKDESRYLLEGMMLGDGHIRNGVWRYYTSSYKLAEDVQRLSLHSGYSGNISLPDGRKKGNNMVMKDGRVITTKHDNYVVAIIISKNNPTVNHGHIHQQNAQVEEWIEFQGKVYCAEVPGNIMYVKRNNKPYWCGNSRSSQKGVCGLLLNQEDMPFTTQGITPDLLINPCCMPSRMTLSQLTESLFGKVCTLKGELGDATPFTSSSIAPTDRIMEELQQLGYERHGNEKMYCGYTGEILEAEVFIGPTYYQRLKHLVKDKMHCLTLDHQVLTRNGWKDIYEVSLDDKVATLNKRGELEYQSPTHVWKYENYDGMMYHIKNQAIDLSVTGNHRMWVSKYDELNYEFEKAEDIVGKVRRYKSDAIWNGEDDVLLSKEKSKDLIDSLMKHNPMTLSKTIADKIQHLCLHSGYSCVINKLNEKDYEVFINKFRHNTLVNVDEKEDVFVNEVCDVMCITVPNEVFYVRRNGKAIWTGNSRSKGNVTMMHHQPSEGRSRDGGLRTGVFISLVIVQITTLC